MAGMQMATYFNNIFKEISKECSTHLSKDGKKVSPQDVEACILKCFTETCLMANDKVIHAPKQYKQCCHVHTNKEGVEIKCTKPVKDGEDMCRQHKAQHEKRLQKESASKCKFANGTKHCTNNAVAGTNFCSKHSKSAAARKEMYKNIENGEISDTSDKSDSDSDDA